MTIGGGERMSGWDGGIGRPVVQRKPVEVDDAVDATDAVCCRRRVSSRVSRFTWYLVLC